MINSLTSSCSSSDCDSSSLPGDSRSPGDQVVPISEGGPGLADAAWEGDTGEDVGDVISRVTRLPSLGNTQSTPSAVSEQSNVSVEQEQEHRQGQVLTAVTRLVLTEFLQAAGLIMT